MTAFVRPRRESLLVLGVDGGVALVIAAHNDDGKEWRQYRHRSRPKTGISEQCLRRALMQRPNHRIDEREILRVAYGRPKTGSQRGLPVSLSASDLPQGLEGSWIDVCLSGGPDSAQ